MIKGDPPPVAIKASARDPVNHPAHYGGADDPYEAIKVIRAWRLGFNLGNTVKYISRAGKKDSAKLTEDLRKAAWYLLDEAAWLEGNQCEDATLRVPLEDHLQPPPRFVSHREEVMAKIEEAPDSKFLNGTGQ